jgi:hypothetical protein
MWKRIVAAAKVLAGVRPAEVRFDELDERIADCCAFAAADIIVGRFVPQPDNVEEDHRTCRRVALVVLDAIKQYASHEATQGPLCREQLTAERNRKRRPTTPGDLEIPF